MNERFALEQIGGRKLRVGRWHAQRKDSAMPLLVFNGIGINLEVMAPLAEKLCDRPVLMFDMPGNGGSPEPLIPYTATQAASWGAELLRRDGYARADLLGISWGGAIAQQFAIQHGRMAGRLALTSIGPGLPFLGAQPGLLSQLADPAYFLGMMRGEAVAGLSPADLSVLTPQFRERLRLPTPRAYLYQMAAITGWFSTPVLPFLRHPTLVVTGEDDRIVPRANAELLASLIPQSRLKIIDGAGHLLVFSHRDRFLSILQDFLESGQIGQNRAA